MRASINALLLTTLIVSCTTVCSVASATIYSDAESGASGWSVRDATPAGARVYAVYDSELRSQVIQTQGDGRLNTYILGGVDSSSGWNNGDEPRMLWKMAVSEPWGIIVHIDTSDGSRRLVYNNSNSNSLDNPSNNTIHYGLGSETTNGQWRDQARNLDSDVSVGEPGITLLAVNGVELMGSMRVDDVALESLSGPEDEKTIVYSDAESGIDGWRVFDNKPAGATVTSVSDTVWGSRVIETRGDGRRNRYLLGDRKNSTGWNNTDKFIFRWDMSTTENYAVQIFVHTRRGLRRLIYTRKNSDSLKSPKNNSIGFGLGRASSNGRWHSYERDLAADVATGEPGNRLLAVNGMMILGSVRLDNITLSEGDAGTPPVNTPPTAVISSNVSSGTAPLRVRFNGSGSSAEGRATIETFNWDFGNGRTSPAENPRTRYAQPGRYSVELTVTDSNGLSDTATTRIMVNTVDTNSCDGFITSAEQFTIPRRAKPNYLNSFMDPVFRGSVTRITNSAFSEVRKPPYSTIQAWNADESLLLLYKTSGGGGSSGHILLDGHSYAPFRELDIVPSDLEEVFWSHSNPDELFYVSKASADYGVFKRYSVASNSSSDIVDFRAQCGSGLPQGGGDVHMQSLDDDLFGFRCRRPDGSYRMLSYQISTGQTRTAEIGSGTPWTSGYAPIPTASGDRFWYQGSALGLNLRTIEQRMDMAVTDEHSSLGRTHDGQDALYQVAFNASPRGCNGDAFSGVGHLIEHNLETGRCRSIISQEQGYPYTTSSTHASALARLQPGLVAMSSVGTLAQMNLFTSGTAAPALFSEIYLADTNPDNPTTCRLAHHRSFGKNATRGGYPAYFGEPHVTISPSGTRLLFGSDWYDSGSVDSFVVELPGYSRP